MSSGCPIKGPPGLLCHPGGAGSERGFLALRTSSSAVTGQKRASSCVPRFLLLTQLAGPKYPTQNAEPLAVLRNSHTPLIDATTNMKPGFVEN